MHRGRGFYPLGKTVTSSVLLALVPEPRSSWLVIKSFSWKFGFIQGESFIYVHLSFDLFCWFFYTHCDFSHNCNLVNCLCILLTADIISTVEFNYSGDLLATGDKGGRVVIFQREQEVSNLQCTNPMKSVNPSDTTLIVQNPLSKIISGSCVSPPTVDLPSNPQAFCNSFEGLSMKSLL